MPTSQLDHRSDADSKAAYVRNMFASIARRYDLLNSILSLNRDKAWRRATVKAVNLPVESKVLDVCTGTGDLAFDFKRTVGGSGVVIGADFCEPMVQLGRLKSGVNSKIPFLLADALQLPFLSDTFDCVSVAFGIRNVSDVDAAFAEMARVAKPGGIVACLEFSRPRNVLVRWLVTWYQMKVLPVVGGLLSRREAYTYLPTSITRFHSREELVNSMARAGLSEIKIMNMHFDSVCLHLGVKR